MGGWGEWGEEDESSCYPGIERKNEENNVCLFCACMSVFGGLFDYCVYTNEKNVNWGRDRKLFIGVTLKVQPEPEKRLKCE